MIYLFDKNLQLLEVLSLPLTATVNRRLVGVDRILVEDFADKKPIIDESSFAGAFLDDHFYIFKIFQKGLNNEKSYFEGVNYAYDELANLTIIEDKRPQNVTASTAILSAIEGTPWTLGTIESTSLQSTNFYFLTPLQAIQKVIEVWQIEPDFYFEFDGKQITGRKIDVFQKRGRLTGERYSYGSNILEIVHEEDQSDVISALYGRGRGVEIFDEEGNPTGGYGRRIDFADIVWSKANGDPVDKPAGQAYVEIPEVTNQYGYPVSGSGLEPRYGVYINDQITDPVELLKETFDVLVQRSRPKVTFSSTVALAGPYELGDTNYIIREDLGIYYEARIFEDEVDLVNPDSTTFKFGDYIPSAQAERVRELQARFDGLTDKIQQVDSSVKNQIIKVSKDWYDALMESKEEIFFSGSSYNYSLEAGNEFGLPAGFYSFDAPIDGNPGPTNFLTIFAGKLGRGTILPGGAWDFDLIGDASGLTADAITAGTIKAQFIEIGPSSTFLEGYDPSTKANAGDVYTKTEMETRFTIRDGEISSKIVTEVTEQIDTAPIYTWIKYADDAQGSGITDDPTGKPYMGVASGQTTATESNDPAAYIWSKIEGPPGVQGLPGLQGPEGDQGIQGPKGADGVSSYTHIAYANSANGAIDFSTSDSSRDYIGMYVDTLPADSTDPADYNWTLIKGAQGDQGIQGPTGPNGQTSYLHIAYATNSTGTSGFSTTVSAGKTYIGQYTDFISADSTDPAKYSWTLIKGEQGDTGPQGIQGPKGADGTTYYTWIKYADTPTSGMSNFPDGKTYMGIAYNKTTATESSTYADYTWSLIQGPQGNQGIQGPAGTDGQTTYTWVKYADTDTGSGMSDSPTGKRFLGLAHNKTTATESTNAADYQWSPLYDNVQVGGRNYFVVGDALENKLLIWANGTPGSETGALTSGFIPVTKGDKFIISPVGTGQLFYYDSEQVHIPLGNMTGGTEITVPENDTISYMRIVFRSNFLNGRTKEEAHVKVEKGNIATDWTPAPEDIQAEMDALAGEIGDVSQALIDLDGYVDGAFHDGVISEAEAKAIEKYLNIVNSEKADVDAKYTKLYANALLAGAAKTDLLAKKNLYNTAHTNLIASINTAISDGKATTAEKTNVDSKFAAYKTALTNLSTAFETASAYLVDAVDGKIEGPGGVLTRLTTVEDKVTPTSIISSVEEVVSVDGSLVLATKSDITQTKDEWKATFSQVGGVNLIEIVKSTNGYYLSATGSAAVNASWAYTDYIEVVPGDKYFASGFSSLGTSPATCFYSSTKAFISGVAGSARETVLAPANAKYMRFSFLIADKPNLMLEKEGGTRTSSTAINNEGVTVEDSIAPNKTTIFPSGMMVRNKETLKQLLTVEPDLTNIPELSADNIYSDTISRAVGNYSFQEINYYVAPTATGDGTGRDESNKADNIQTALRNATNDGLILKNVNIIINVAPGKYNGLIRIMGYSGNGEIAILFGAGVYINGNIDIIDCSCRVRLNSGATGNFVLTKGTYLNPVTIINCSHVMLERPVIIHPLSTGYPIYIESSRVVVSSYDIAGSGGVSPARAVYADYNSQVYMMFGKGNTQNGPFNASRGSIITAYYGIPNPALSSAADCDTTTGTYFGKNTSRTNSAATPPTITWQTVTKTFQGRLYRVNNATGYRTDGSFIQGTSPNTGDSYKGYVSWGKEIYDYLQDNGGYQSLTSIKLITERGGYGYGNVSLKVASPAARTGTSQARYSTAETELVGYTLGTSVSTSQNLILSTTTTATTDYANFTKVLLKITVQKKV